MKLLLGREWEIGPQIGSGGFGNVYVAVSEGQEAAIKLIPKDPGAERELLFVDLAGLPNVIPIIDSGETDHDWVIAMPRAEMSLHDRLDGRAEGPDFAEAVNILLDIAKALAGLAGRVVHRDLKPKNVLLLSGHWCLADFGISRYADAATGPNTKKGAGTPEYVAPERWRGERAVSATDVYALGVIGYEILARRLPFNGPDYREQHLHADPPTLVNVPDGLAALVEECLFKAPGARPTAVEIVRRLTAFTSEVSPGLGYLQKAHRAEVKRVGRRARLHSAEVSAAERVAELVSAATALRSRWAKRLEDEILRAAPAARMVGDAIVLGETALRLSPLQSTVGRPAWEIESPHATFTVAAYCEIAVTIPTRAGGYSGRSHSLWFCDAIDEGTFRWFETAFYRPSVPRVPDTRVPVALPPGEKSARALWSAISPYRAAWPFSPIETDTMGDFIDRWVGWFGRAASGHLERPAHVPETELQDGWR